MFSRLRSSCRSRGPAADRREIRVNINRCWRRMLNLRSPPFQSPVKTIACVSVTRRLPTASSRASTSSRSQCSSRCATAAREKDSSRTMHQAAARRRTPLTSIAISAAAVGAEDALQLVRRRDLELIVPAVGGWLVGTPALKDCGVPEARPLHVIVLDLADALEPQRFPREVLARTPPALAAGHAGHVRSVDLGPFAPGMILQRARAERRELIDELPAHRHRERRGDADVMERAFR